MPVSYGSAPNAAGTTLSISTTAPATHDTAGFAAIAAGSWQPIGSVVNTGGLPRPVRDRDTVDLLNGTSIIIPQNQRMEPLEVETIYQPTDVGQLAVAAAADGKTVRYFRWLLPNGVRVYAAGYVDGYGPTLETASDYVAAVFTIIPLFEANGVGPVIATA